MWFRARLLLISIGLSLILWTTTAMADRIPIPPDVRAWANQLEFIAQEAQRCEIQLLILGRKGIIDEACVTFRQRFSTFNADQSKFQRTEDLFSRVDASSDVWTKWTWNQLLDDMEAHMALISKTTDHMTFLQHSVTPQTSQKRR